MGCCRCPAPGVSQEQRRSHLAWEREGGFGDKRVCMERCWVYLVGTWSVRLLRGVQNKGREETQRAMTNLAHVCFEESCSSAKRGNPLLSGKCVVLVFPGQFPAGRAVRRRGTRHQFDAIVEDRAEKSGMIHLFEKPWETNYQVLG